MPVTVDLSDEALVRLRAEAARRGTSIDEVIAELVAQLPPEATAAPGRKLAFVAAGASRSGVTDRIDDLLADGFGRD
jgi:hypothetical protein